MFWVQNIMGKPTCAKPRSLSHPFFICRFLSEYKLNRTGLPARTWSCGIFKTFLPWIIYWPLLMFAFLFSTISFCFFFVPDSFTSLMVFHFDKKKLYNAWHDCRTVFKKSQIKNVMAQQIQRMKYRNDEPKKSLCHGIRYLDKMLLSYLIFSRGNRMESIRLVHEPS